MGRGGSAYSHIFLTPPTYYAIMTSLRKPSQVLILSFPGPADKAQYRSWWGSAEKNRSFLALRDRDGSLLALVGRGSWIFSLHLFEEVVFLQLYVSLPAQWKAYVPPYGVRRQDETHMYLFLRGGMEGEASFSFPFPLPYSMEVARQNLSRGVGESERGWVLPTPWKGVSLNLLQANNAQFTSFHQEPLEGEGRG